MLIECFGFDWFDRLCLFSYWFEIYLFDLNCCLATLFLWFYVLITFVVCGCLFAVVFVLFGLCFRSLSALVGFVAIDFGWMVINFVYSLLVGCWICLVFCFNVISRLLIVVMLSLVWVVIEICVFVLMHYYDCIVVFALGLVLVLWDGNG